MFSKCYISLSFLAARDIRLCNIEALKAEKSEAAFAIVAACQASKDAGARRDEAISEADNLR